MAKSISANSPLKKAILPNVEVSAFLEGNLCACAIVTFQRIGV